MLSSHGCELRFLVAAGCQPICRLYKLHSQCIAVNINHPIGHSLGTTMASPLSAFFLKLSTSVVVPSEPHCWQRCRKKISVSAHRSL